MSDCLINYHQIVNGFFAMWFNQLSREHKCQAEIKKGFHSTLKEISIFLRQAIEEGDLAPLLLNSSYLSLINLKPSVNGYDLEITFSDKEKAMEFFQKIVVRLSYLEMDDIIPDIEEDPLRFQFAYLGRKVPAQIKGSLVTIFLPSKAEFVKETYPYLLMREAVLT